MTGSAAHRSAASRSAGARGGPGPPADSGAILLLTIGYALIAMALIVVAVDASAFFLSRRALASLADGAAVAGTHAEDGNRIYQVGTGADLPLTVDGVRSEVVSYLTARDQAAADSAVSIAEVGTDGRTVSVSLAQDKPLPFLGLVNSITGAFPGGTARIEVTARARAPITL